MEPEKTDKQLVWEALKRIKEITSDIYAPPFVILPEDIWSDYDKDVKLRIRGLLLSNDLIYLVGGGLWAFGLTAKAMVLKEKDLKQMEL